MKRICDMKEEELLALSDEQISIMIDYECALDGVPMLPPAPGEAPTKESVKPDIQAYEIGTFITTSIEHAGRILDVLNSEQLYKKRYPSDDYSIKCLDPIKDDYEKPKIEAITVHSPEQWDRIKNDYTQYATKKKAWERIDSAYKAALKERQKISDAVIDAIRNASQHAYDRERLREEFKRYLVLAEGNNQIALNFLEKVKDLSEFPELRNEFCPTQMEEGI